MSTASPARIYRLGAASIFAAGAAVVLPRFMPSGDGGLAAAASAALWFFVLAAIGVVLALVALVISIRHFASLPWPARMAGIVPAIVLGATLGWLVLSLH
jgi:hypothetical protein